MSVASIVEVLEMLKAKAEPENLEGMKRYGMTLEKRLGVSVPEMRKIAKQLGKDHLLAQGLWQTGIAEAMIVASMVGEPEKVTGQQMETWVKEINSWDVCDQVCMNLFDKAPLAWRKVFDWSNRKEEYVKRAAFALLACLAWHDKEAPDDAFTRMLPVIKSGANDDRNYVKKAVSWALRNIGKRNAHLHVAALATANELKAMESKTARWIANDVIRDLTGETAQRRLEHAEA
jgi:3-methyladenine DNA glycosylase AlkD